MTIPRALTTTVMIGLLFLALLSSKSAYSEAESNRVFVENFPETQRIAGQVVVDDPIPATRFEVFEKMLITLTGRREATRLIPGGVLNTRGFSKMDITIMGLVKGKNRQAAEVGAILIPDVPFAREAFNEEEVLLAGMEISTKVSGAKTFYFSTEPKSFRIAFPRYRIYYFNDGERAVQVQTYATLSQ